VITLEVLAGARRGTALAFDGAAVTVGRSQGCQLQLPDEGVASEQVQIFREEDQYIVRDLQSGQPTRVRRGNAEIALDERNRFELPLRDGDSLCFGEPTSAVVVACRFAESESTVPAARIQAERAFTDFARVSDDVTRDSDAARKL